MAAEPSAPASRFKPMTLALASTGVLAAWTALPPEADRPWNFAVLGAVGLFAAARLPFRQAITVMLLAILVKDVSVYLTLGWPPSPLSWLGFAAYVLIGRTLLTHTESPLRIGSGAAIASFLFFLVSNFGSWLSQSLPYGYTFAGLLEWLRANIHRHGRRATERQFVLVRPGPRGRRGVTGGILGCVPGSARGVHTRAPCGPRRAPRWR